MNFDAFWQTHRRFLMGIAAGLVLFLIAEAILGSTVGSRHKRGKSSIQSQNKILRSSKWYGSSSVTELRQRLNELDDRAGNLVGRTLPVLPEAYQPEEGQSWRQHYIQLSGDVREDLIPWALRQNVEVDESLGLPPTSPNEPQKIQKVLRGLAVVEQVVRLAVASGAEKVDDMEISTRAPKRIRGLGDSVLDLTPVSLEVHLPDEKVHTFVQALLQHQPPLGLDQLSVTPPDKRGRARRVYVQLAAGGMPQLEEEL
ncbi:MAG: hypothetical protein DWQ01_15630 [Planctomycetota bacterium]|nr:MAG: hypothetical protein DWQ01_15630 [Planctomycetota bacterium]